MDPILTKLIIDRKFKYPALIGQYDSIEMNKPIEKIDIQYFFKQKKIFKSLGITSFVVKYRITDRMDKLITDRDLKELSTFLNSDKLTNISLQSMYGREFYLLQSIRARLLSPCKLFLTADVLNITTSKPIIRRYANLLKLVKRLDCEEISFDGTLPVELFIMSFQNKPISVIRNCSLICNPKSLPKKLSECIKNCDNMTLKLFKKSYREAKMIISEFKARKSHNRLKGLVHFQVLERKSGLIKLKLDGIPITLTGDMSGETSYFPFPSDENVFDLKMRLEYERGVSHEAIEIWFENKRQDDNRNLISFRTVMSHFDYKLALEVKIINN